MLCVHCMFFCVCFLFTGPVGCGMWIAFGSPEEATLNLSDGARDLPAGEKSHQIQVVRDLSEAETSKSDAQSRKAWAPV